MLKSAIKINKLLFLLLLLLLLLLLVPFPNLSLPIKICLARPRPSSLHTIWPFVLLQPLSQTVLQTPSCSTSTRPSYLFVPLASRTTGTSDRFFRTSDSKVMFPQSFTHWVPSEELIKTVCHSMKMYTLVPKLKSVVDAKSVLDTLTCYLCSNNHWLCRISQGFTLSKIARILV